MYPPRLLRCLLLLMACCGIGKAHAQNLVPNGSFEEYTQCPVSFGWAEYAVGWQQLYTRSADYFNACNTNGVAGIPSNEFGYQHAADGQAYVGMGTYLDGDPLYREFLGVELVEPLQPGVPVCLSFKMAMGGFGSDPGNSAPYTAKGVGLQFFVDLPASSNPFWESEWASYLYPNSAALYLDVLPTDTSLWYAVSGTYIPDSAYRYMVVGNFFADSLSSPFLFDTVYGISNVAYAFIDDIRASVDLSFCDSSSGVSMTQRKWFKVGPNPCMDELMVEVPMGNEGLWRVALYNSTGALVQEHERMSGPVIRLRTGRIPAGVYHLRLMAPSGLYHSSIVVHTTD